jgi:hypothetical protein
MFRQPALHKEESKEEYYYSRSETTGLRRVATSKRRYAANCNNGSRPNGHYSWPVFAGPGHPEVGVWEKQQQQKQQHPHPTLSPQGRGVKKKQQQRTLTRPLRGHPLPQGRGVKKKREEEEKNNFVRLVPWAYAHG